MQYVDYIITAGRYTQAWGNPTNTKVGTGRADFKGPQPQLPTIQSGYILHSHLLGFWWYLYSYIVVQQGGKEWIWADKDMYQLGSANELSTSFFG